MAGGTGPLILAIDLGTSGPKVALVRASGEVLDHDFVACDLILREGGGAEQDPDQWWSAVSTGIRRLVARRPDDAAAIEAISVTAQWMGTVPVDAHGRHLMNALIWMDARGADLARRQTSGGIPVPGTTYGAAKLWRWLRHTGGVPSTTGKDPVGHILWIKRNLPEIDAATATYLEPMDWLNMRLCGRRAASYDSIVGHWCTDSRDLTRVEYVDSLIRLSGLDRRQLPDLLPTGAIVGTVDARVASDLGIPSSAKVVTATGDTSSAGIGAGAIDEHSAHLYVGTSSWLSCHVPYKRTDVFNNITSLPSGIPGRYWVATEQDVAGKCLTWLAGDVLFPGEEQRTALQRLNDIAAESPPGSGGAIFAPWLNGERTPVEDSLVRGGWFNVSLTTDRSALVRSVFEGVALNTRWMLRATEKFVRRSNPRGFDAIRFVGGGATSPLWCQIMADVLDRRILQMAEPTLANLRGAAFCATVALGDASWDDIASRVQVQQTFEPDARNRALYDRLFAAFTDIYKRNRTLYAGLNRDGGLQLPARTAAATVSGAAAEPVAAVTSLER